MAEDPELAAIRARRLAEMQAQVKNLNFIQSNNDTQDLLNFTYYPYYLHTVHRTFPGISA